jgi:hypothetical protein
VRRVGVQAHHLRHAVARRDRLIRPDRRRVLAAADQDDVPLHECALAVRLEIAWPWARWATLSFYAVLDVIDCHSLAEYLFTIMLILLPLLPFSTKMTASPGVKVAGRDGQVGQPRPPLRLGAELIAVDLAMGGTVMQTFLIILCTDNQINHDCYVKLSKVMAV